MKKIDQMRERGDLEPFSKKEKARIEKEYARLNDYLSGIREMKKPPSALFVVDIQKENIAVAEARRLNIPVVALVDTNCDPGLVDFPIPGNDDATRSIAFFIHLISEACLKGKEKWRDKLRQKGSGGENQDEASSDLSPPAYKGGEGAPEGPTVVKVFKTRKLVAAGTADDVEISLELENKKKSLSLDEASPDSGPPDSGPPDSGPPDRAEGEKRK